MSVGNPGTATVAHMSAADNAAWDVTDFTAFMRVRFDAWPVPEGTFRMVWQGADNLAERFAIFVNQTGGIRRTALRVGALPAQLQIGDYVVGEWSWICATLDTGGGTFGLFTGAPSFGIRTSTGAEPSVPVAATTPMSLGGGPGSAPWAMAIDDIQLFNRALSANEVANLGLGQGQQEITAGKIAHWRALNAAPGVAVAAATVPVPQVLTGGPAVPLTEVLTGAANTGWFYDTTAMTFPLGPSVQS